MTVICNRHKTDIISRKDPPKDIKWTYLENWEHIKHIKLDRTLVGGLYHWTNRQATIQPFVVHHSFPVKGDESTNWKEISLVF